ncbi:MAG: major capsid protein [Pseudomonas sp.]
MKKYLSRGLVAAASLGSLAAANAAAIDVTDVVTDIAAQATPIGLVGSAVLIIYGAVKAFKWVRAALS